jgi:hypothetical protein
MASASAVHRGLEIIMKYEPDAETAAEHDEIFCGDYQKTSSKMTKEELEEMEGLGWHGRERDNCWAKFT